MIKDYFILALKNIKKRKLRSWLTLIGIFISIAVIFTLISLSLGLQGAIQEQFQLLGADKFFISAKGSFSPGSLGAATLTTADFEIVKKVNGVKDVGYIVMGNAKVEYAASIRYFPIIGLSQNGAQIFLASSSVGLLEGKMMESQDVNKVIIGYDYKLGNVYPKPVELGSKLKINDVDFKVKGIIERFGDPTSDKYILMNINDFQTLFNSGNRVDEIIVQVQSGENITEVAAKVEKKLRSFRNVNEKTQDFTIQTPDQLLESFQTILTIITAFLLSVAAISLIVGAIGIANTMYTSVLERTKEIGVMKAIGAKNSDILWIFVIEAGLIGMLGGIIGVILGIIISKSVEFIAIAALGTTLLKAALPWYLIVGCIGFAFLIGVISGLLPARQAAKTKVVDAIRYE